MNPASILTISDMALLKKNLRKYSERDVSANEILMALRFIMQNWLGELSAAEFKIVMFIFHRTYGWNKRAERIFIEQFTTGMRSKEDKIIIQSIGLKARRVKQVLSILEAREYIFRESEGKFTWFMLNIGRNSAPDYQGQQEITARKKITSEGARKCTHKYKNNKHININNKNDSEEKSSHSHVKGDFNLKNRENVPELQKLWKSKVKETFPESPVINWTKKECGQMKNFLNNYRKNDNEARFSDLIEFAIENWARVGQLKLSWAKNVNYPEYPSVGFVCGFKRYFIEAFADDQFHERQLGMTEHEREIKKLKRYGYTDEQADQELSRREERFKPLEKERERADQAEREVVGAVWEKKRLEREVRRIQIENDKQCEALKKMNRGSDKKKPEKPKKKIKRDADGYAVFTGKRLDEFDDKPSKIKK